MGCYGIGISRLMGVIAEKMHDERGLVWAPTIAPYTHVIIVVGDHLREAVALGEDLERQGYEVMIDDREIGFGQKAGDADLIGIPHRIVVSDKTIVAGGYEFKNRKESETRIVEYAFPLFP
jgi:prolyl-tRNA synthetase